MMAKLHSARVLAVITAVCAVLAWSSGLARAGEGGRVPMPQIPKAQGGQCVASADEMRRNHMNLLKHERDDAVHLGERKTKAQLENCLTCHAVNGANGKPVTYDDGRHFCRTCHDYAAVAVDCFQCHASVPNAAKTAEGKGARLGSGQDKLP